MLPYLLYAILIWHWHPIHEKIDFSAGTDTCTINIRHGYWVDHWRHVYQGNETTLNVEAHESCTLATDDGVNYTMDCNMQPGWINSYLREDGRAFIPKSDPDNPHDFDPRDYVEFPLCSDVPNGAVCIMDSK